MERRGGGAGRRLPRRRRRLRMEKAKKVLEAVGRGRSRAARIGWLRSRSPAGMTTRKGKDVALGAAFFLRLSGAAAGEAHEGVDDGAGEADDRGEEQRVDAAEFFGASVEECEGEQEHGAAADEDERELIAGDAEGALEAGFGAAKDDEGEELEDERGSPEDEVDGDEALEGEAERESPGGAAGEDARPRGLRCGCGG